MKTKKGNRLIEATYYNRNPKEDYAICVFEKGDNGKLYDRVITVGSKKYCEDWVENYCRQYSWNRGMHKIKPVTEVNSIEFKRDYFGNNNYEDDFADLEDMLDNYGVSINRRDVFGESKNRKNIVKLTESQLKKIISESIKKIILERNFESDRRWEDYIPPRIKDVDFYFFADSDYIRNVLNYNEDSPEIKEAVHCILNMANDETIPYITPFKVDLNSDDEIIDWDNAIESLPKNIRDLILEMVGEFIGQTNYR